MSIKKQQFSGCCFHCFEAWDYSPAGTIKDTVIVLNKADGHTQPIICLDAGHYGKYNSSPAIPEYYESDMNRKLHLMLKSSLEKYGIKANAERQLARLRAAGFDAFIS